MINPRIVGFVVLPKMVVGTGFEPVCHVPYLPGTQYTYKNYDEGCPLIGTHKAVQRCPLLADVVKVWDSLDEASKQAIALLAKAGAMGGAK
jgi:hypothetical protein